MAGRFVSVFMTLSDLERLDGRNQIFFRQILITLIIIIIVYYAKKGSSSNKSTYKHKTANITQY